MPKMAFHHMNGKWMMLYLNRIVVCIYSICAHCTYALQVDVYNSISCIWCRKMYRMRNVQFVDAHWLLAVRVNVFFFFFIFLHIIIDDRNFTQLRMFWLCKSTICYLFNRDVIFFLVGVVFGLPLPISAFAFIFSSVSFHYIHPLFGNCRFLWSHLMGICRNWLCSWSDWICIYLANRS